MKTIKTISKLAMLFAFVAFANTLIASENLKVNILPLTSETAVVAISSTAASNFQISIENENGEIIYYKQNGADSKDYRQVFDFSNLEAGEYKLTASIDGSTTERSFKIEHENISVGIEKSNLAPFFAYKEGVLKLSYLNYTEENVNVNFYDEKELVYAKEIGKKFNVTHAFDLTKLNRGSYSVVLSTDSKSYSYNLDVK